MKTGIVTKRHFSIVVAYT